VATEATPLKEIAAEQVAEEFELLEVTRAPGANDQVQSEVQPLAHTKRPVHRFGDQRHHGPARLKQSKQPSSAESC